MKKSLLALAVLGASAGAASAQSSVTLYGIVDIGYSYLDVKRDGVSSVSSIDSGQQSGSRIGFRGREDLGRGLGAIFQLEAGYQADNGSQTGQSSVNVANRLFGRVAYAGLDSGFGQVVLGRFGTFGSGTGPFDMFSEIDPFSTGFRDAGMQNSLSETGGLRFDNTILYRTPVWGGFQAGAMYSFQVDGSEQTPSGANTKGVSAGASWRGGPIYAALSYSQLKFPDAAGFEDQKILQVGGTWDFKVAKLHAAYAKEENVRGAPTAANQAFGIAATLAGTTIPALAGADGDAWMVGVTVPLGAFSVFGSYQARDGDTVSTPTGSFKAEGYGWALGATYAFSKRTNGYIAWADLSGDESLNEGTLNPPPPGSFTASDLANRSRLMPGIRHFF
jgi:predicted porin